MGRNYFNMVSRFYLLLAFALAIISFSCTPRQVAAPEVKTVEKPQATAIKVGLSWEQEWEDLVKAAQKEGKIIIYAGLSGDVVEAFRKNFGERYGIKIELVSARTPQLTAKIFMERQNGLYIPDVYMEGVSTVFAFFKPRGILQLLDDIVFRPDVLDEKIWWGAYGPFFDKGHYIAGATRDLSLPVTFNTKMVNPEELTSYKDLLNPQWKGKILMYDPTSSGSGQNSMLHALEIMGEDYIRNLAEQVGMLIRDKRQIVEWVGRGKYPISFGAGASATLEFIKVGAPVGLANFKEGHGTSATASVVLFDRAPHPATAKLFVNWVLTKEGQEVYGVASGRLSRRLDVSDEHILPVQKMKEGVKYNIGDEGFQLRSPENIEIIKKYYLKLL